MCVRNARLTYLLRYTRNRKFAHNLCVRYNDIAVIISDGVMWSIRKDFCCEKFIRRLHDNACLVKKTDSWIFKIVFISEEKLRAISTIFLEIDWIHYRRLQRTDIWLIGLFKTWFSSCHPRTLNTTVK